MSAWNVIRRHSSTFIVLVSLTLIAIHLANAALFHYSSPWSERIGYTVAALAVCAAGGLMWSSLPAFWRGLFAFTAGFFAFTTGVGIHVMHIVMRGPEASDYTGLGLALGGLGLTTVGAIVLVRCVHDWRRRLVAVPLALGFLVYVVAPVTMGVSVTNIPRKPVCCEDTPATRGLVYEDVRFHTEQGVAIGGWYIPTQNGAAIITVHGAGSNRAMVMDEAEVLARNGYGVLMIDVEGFGESEGKSNSFGWVGARDVAAAVDYLKTRPDVQPGKIGALGLSVGGEILVEAAAEHPDLQAIVAEGISGRSYDDFEEIEIPIYKAMMPFHWTAAATMVVLTGEPVPPALFDLMPKVAPRDVLLISANIEEERLMNRRYQEAGGTTVQWWQMAESKHVGGLDLRPEEYERRVISFFDESLRPSIVGRVR